MSKKDQFVSLNGEILPKEEAFIPADSSAIRYGTGCFETFRAESGKIFNFNKHIERLNRGINYLSGGSISPKSEDELRYDVDDLLKANKILSSDARIRIQFILDEQSGYNPENNPQSYLLISASEIILRNQSLSLVVAKTKVIPSSSRPPGLKLSNMLHYRNAWREAKQQGADDAILFTQNDAVAETSIANLFWKRDDKIYTPDITCDILPGVMRNSLIDMIRNNGHYAVEEGKYDIQHLMSAESVWVTNSVREILMVSTIEGRKFDLETDFCKALKEHFHEYKKEFLN